MVGSLITGAIVRLSERVPLLHSVLTVLSLEQFRDRGSRFLARRSVHEIL